MRRKILLVLNILIMIAMVVIIVYQVYVAPQMDTAYVRKASTILVAYVLAFLGIRRKKSPFDYKIYEDEYKDIIRTAFEKDRRSYKKLMKAIGLFNDDKYGAAIKILDKLRDNCISYQDTSAVLMFKALCCTGQKQYHQGIEVYRELLRVDVANSRAWSNLGYAYMNMSRSDLAREAFEKAIVYNRENAAAYNNMAIFCLDSGEFDEALTNALTALKLNNKMKGAQQVASLCYAYLGEKEQALHYCKLYGANGGDGKELKKKLENIWQN